jgi:NAD(P)-dependent dehydrogenase (short-subunit alcohol dehydrogenase family)
MRTALVTGAAGGIGEALCQAFGGAGYRVLGTDREPAGRHCDAFVTADLARLARDEAYRGQILAELRAALGENELRVLVNNAAVQIVRSTPALRQEDWQQTLETNLLAPFYLVQGLLGELERARGAVINIGSIHTALTKPGFVCYATSKAALAGLTRSLAVDLGATVRVNGISPAATETPMLLAGFEGRQESLDALSSVHPIGRIAKPSEVAKVAVFLASDDASFITGSILDVHGGIGACLLEPR